MTEIFQVPVTPSNKLAKEIAEISRLMSGHELLFVYQDTVNA